MLKDRNWFKGDDNDTDVAPSGENALMSDATKDYSRAPDQELLDKIYASIDELAMELLTSGDEISDQVRDIVLCEKRNFITSK